MLASHTRHDPIPSATAHSVASSAPRRYSITFYPSSTATVFLSNEPSLVAGHGLTLSPGQTPLYLCVEQHGDCVQREWYAVYEGSLNPIGIVEAIMCGEKNQGRANQLSGRHGAHVGVET